MNNSILKYGLILLGEAILVTALLLFFQEQWEEKLLYLNLVVISFVYLANVLFQPSLFTSSEKFDKQVSGIGISWFFTGLYSFLAVIGVIVGSWATLVLEWQCLYQAAFFALYLSGIYWAKLANEKSRRIDRDTKSTYTEINSLKEHVAQLQAKAARQTLPNEIKEHLEYIAKRMEYLSPNPGATARMTEADLSKEFSALESLLQTQPVPATEIKERLLFCESLIKKRLQLTI